jgi:hypothetical protein
MGGEGSTNYLSLAVGKGVGGLIVANVLPFSTVTLFVDRTNKTFRPS